MPESLLSPSNILLYGRLVADLQIVHEDDPQAEGRTEEQIHQPFVASRGGRNNFLQEQLKDPESGLARIYGFSFEGQYYDLAKPALFLVHGAGEVADRAVRRAWQCPVSAGPRRGRSNGRGRAGLLILRGHQGLVLRHRGLLDSSGCRDRTVRADPARRRDAAQQARGQLYRRERAGEWGERAGHGSERASQRSQCAPQGQPRRMG